MNIRKIIFAGILTALIGSMFGLALTKIAQREDRGKIMLITGATLGFLVGAFQESIQQQKKIKDDDYGDVNSWK